MKIKRLISLGLISLSMLSTLIIAQKPSITKAIMPDLDFVGYKSIEGYSTAVDSTSETSFRTIGCTLYNKETNQRVHLFRASDGDDSNNKNRYSVPFTAKYYKLINRLTGETSTSLKVTHQINFQKILEDNLFGNDFEHFIRTAKETNFVFNAIIGLKYWGKPCYEIKKDSGGDGLINDLNGDGRITQDDGEIFHIYTPHIAGDRGWAGYLVATEGEIIGDIIDDYSPTAKDLAAWGGWGGGTNTADFTSYFCKNLQLTNDKAPSPYAIGSKGYASGNVVQEMINKSSDSNEVTFDPEYRYWVRPGEANYFYFGGASYVAPYNVVKDDANAVNYDNSVQKMYVNIQRVGDLTTKDVWSKIPSTEPYDNSATYLAGTTSAPFSLASDFYPEKGRKNEIYGINDANVDWGTAPVQNTQRVHHTTKQNTFVQGYDFYTNMKLNLANNGDGFKVYLKAKNRIGVNSSNGKSSVKIKQLDNNTLDTSGWVYASDIIVDGTAPQYDTPSNYSKDETYTADFNLMFENLKDVRGGDERYYLDGVGVKSVSYEILDKDNNKLVDETTLISEENKNTDNTNFTISVPIQEAMDEDLEEIVVKVTTEDKLGNSETSDFPIKIGNDVKAKVQLEDAYYKDKTNLEYWAGPKHPDFTTYMTSSSNTKYPNIGFINLVNNGEVASTLLHEHSVNLTLKDADKGMTSGDYSSNSRFQDIYYSSRTGTKNRPFVMNTKTGILPTIDESKKFSAYFIYQPKFASNTPNGIKLDLTAQGGILESGDITEESGSFIGALSEEVKEEKGRKVCYDKNSPQITLVEKSRLDYASGHELLLKISDQDSGIKDYKVFVEGEELTSKTDISSETEKVCNTEATLVVGNKDYVNVKIITHDNVDNEQESTFNLELKNTKVSIKGKQIYYDSNIGEDDERFHIRSTDKNKKVVKVDAKGTYTSTSGLLDIGTLYEVYDQSKLLIANNRKESPYRMEGTQLDHNNNPVTLINFNSVYHRSSDYKSYLGGSFYVDDIVNTKEAPQITYNEEEGILSWNELKDVEQLLEYNITELDESITNPNMKHVMHSLRDSDSHSSKPSCTWKTKWCSGYDHYTLKLYTGTYNSVDELENVTPLLTKSEDFLAFDLNGQKEGDYTVTVIMYDYNGNPSSKGILNFHYVPKKVDIALQVTAVKDVHWETAPYPFEYTTIDEDNNFVDGEHKSNFPLGGGNYKYNKSSIAKGYMVNYNINTYKGANIDSFEIRYRYYSTKGKRLVIETEDGEDISKTEGKAYSNIKFSDERISELKKGNQCYFKHFIPENSKAFLNGEEYNKPITVGLEFVINGKSEKIIKMYCIDQSRLATDDLDSDKIR